MSDHKRGHTQENASQEPSVHEDSQINKPEGRYRRPKPVKPTQESPPPTPELPKRQPRNKEELRERATELFNKYSRRNPRYIRVGMPVLDGIQWELPEPASDDPEKNEAARLAHIDEQLKTIFEEGGVALEVEYNETKPRSEQIDASTSLPRGVLRAILKSIPNRSPKDPDPKNQAAWEEWGYGQLKARVVDFLVNRDLEDLRKQANAQDTQPSAMEPPQAHESAIPSDIEKPKPQASKEPKLETPATPEAKPENPTLEALTGSIANSIENHPLLREMLAGNREAAKKMARSVAVLFLMKLENLDDADRVAFQFFRTRLGATVDTKTQAFTITNIESFKPYLEYLLKE